MAKYTLPFTEMSKEQDWIGLQFLKVGGSGLDRTEKIFCCFNVIILKISKILVVIRFHRFAKW